MSAENISAEAQIHPTAIIEDGAKIAAGVKIGPYSVIGSNVEIGEDTIVGSSVLKGICENPKAYLAIFIDLMYQMEIISKKDMEMAVLRQNFAIMIGKGFKDLRSEFIENL